MSHTEVKVCKVVLVDSPLLTCQQVLPGEIATEH